MAPSRVAGGMAHSSSSSGIFFQGDGQSQVAGNSHLTSSFGNSSNSLPGNARSSLGPLSGDVSNTVLNSVASSGPSVGASSLVTDANSGLSGGPNLQRSASINTESYMRLPASPLSFSSNNISVSGSSVMDGSSVAQQSSNQDPNSQQPQHNQQRHGTSSATSLPTSRVGQVQLGSGQGLRVPGSFIQDPAALSQMQKKPRLDIKQDDVMQQQVLQQLLQRQDPVHMQNPSPQLQALVQQQRLRQQQQQQHQLLQYLPPLQRAQLLQQQQQLQLRQQMQQQSVQPVSGMKRPSDGVLCSRRLMQYLYHQRQRPSDNSIAYWRKFVSEYYSPRAKKRWCLSLYENVGHHSLGVFPQSTMDAWHCDICGSKSGRGFEATFEVLPRLNEIKFSSGVIDELLFLDFPRECRFPSGLMMLEYAKAVQESVYEQLRVVREGRLRIIFTSDLKILSWEFCARRHEELLPRRLVAPQVNQLLQVAQKCQSTLTETGPDGVSQEDLQANSNMVVTTGRQLAKSLELQSLNDLGFSKRYVRCLQIAEVVNSMKDLMDFCSEHKAGSIEGLKSFPRHDNTAKFQMQNIQETEQQVGNIQGLPTDRSALNKLMALHPGLNNQISNNQHMGGRGALSGSGQAALSLSNFQNSLMRQNSMNSNTNPTQQDASSSFNNSNHSQSSLLQGPNGMLPGTVQNLPVSGLSSTNLQQQQQQLLSSGLLSQNQSQSSQGSQALQQQMIQQLLQDMNTNNGVSGVQQQCLSGQSGGGSASREGLAFGNNGSGVQQQCLSGQSGSASREGLAFGNNGSIAAATSSHGPGSSLGPTPGRIYSFKSASNCEPSALAGNSGFSKKTPDLPRSYSFKSASNCEPSSSAGNSGFSRKGPDLPPSMHVSDDDILTPEMVQEFAENGFLSSDIDNNMSYPGWKG
ncbi:probable transcriptional regulator SLK2 isoform X1 [Solanum stenotomum]|uniref:probable transcriptional regulator SLK2 isoform X1 n=1 Tax=Solanum stenotomum TaxID=172797 RepID=UPI0020D1C7CF|nr:probable transcriptional regulator SLK2 isoform X1 [Solanum stenotomum]XP_049393466.1 probable transcriptional regulator SLK2 isoform X1 [Solanum stenotomum]